MSLSMLIVNLSSAISCSISIASVFTDVWRGELVRTTVERVSDHEIVGSTACHHATLLGKSVTHTHTLRDFVMKPYIMSISLVS